MLHTPSRPSYKVFESLTTRIDISISDSQSRTICRGSGFPAGPENDHIYVTSTPNGAIGLWHMACSEVQLGHCDSCRLTVAIRDVDRTTPAVVVVPTIEGGGFELP
jgi:hypothetical protein